MKSVVPIQRTAHSYGLAAEQHVRHFLQNCGYNIIEYNVHQADAEIDIIAHHDDTIAFIEVKASSSHTHDLSERITPAKQRRLQKAARHYISIHELEQYTVRFDVALVHNQAITYIENAFYADI